MGKEELMVVAFELVAASFTSMDPKAPLSLKDKSGSEKTMTKGSIVRVHSARDIAYMQRQSAFKLIVEEVSEDEEVEAPTTEKVTTVNRHSK